MVLAQMEEVQAFLKQTVGSVGDYLDHHSLDAIINKDSELDSNYHKILLKQLRRLEVFCTEALDAVSVILHSESFRKPAAEKTLYGIYHQCIAEFFAPKADIWYEDSRAAYTGRNAIRFYEKPANSLELLIRQLENPFQSIREELEYYETDYQTKVIMKKDSSTAN